MYFDFYLASVAAITSPVLNIHNALSCMPSTANMGIVITSTGVNASRSEIGFTWRF